MAGKLVLSTLNDDTGALATQNGMTGIAKAWVNFNGTGTVAIRDSFNVSSITDNGTGVYTVNLTNALPNANYSVVASSEIPNTGAGTAAVQLFCNNVGGSLTPVTPTTTAFTISTLSFNGNFADLPRICVSVFSS